MKMSKSLFLTHNKKKIKRKKTIKKIKIIKFTKKHLLEDLPRINPRKLLPKLVKKS